MYIFVQNAIVSECKYVKLRIKIRFLKIHQKFKCM